MTETPRISRRDSLRVVGGSVLCSMTVGVSGCLDVPWGSGIPPDGSDPSTGLPTDANVDETTAVSGLEVPWDLTFAGEDAFFTERDVGIRTVSAEELRTATDLTADETDVLVPKSALPDQETLEYGGILGVAAHPQYPEVRQLYVYYSYDDGEPQNRVARYDLEAETIDSIVDSIPGMGVHHGGRIKFGPEGNLWILTGDAEQPELAQNPQSLGGGTLRVTPEGDPAPGNPDFDEADPRMVTMGYRNPQGIAFGPDGEGYICDHGPVSRDEVAVIRPGGNYGWDIARGGPDDPEYDSYSDHPEFEPPVVNTGPNTTWAPSGAMFYTDDAIDPWRNRLFACGLRSRTLYAITLVRPEEDGPPLGQAGVRFDEDWMDDAYTATAHPLYEGDFGRLRKAVQGPNGSVFLLTSNRDGVSQDEFPKDADDRIVRIDPA